MRLVEAITGPFYLRTLDIWDFDKGIWDIEVFCDLGHWKDCVQ